MRPNIRQLIDLIEREGWVLLDAPIRPADNVSISHFRPRDLPYPRICFAGVQIDEATYESFSDQEIEYARSVFARDREIKTSRRAEVVNTKLNQFLATRKAS